MTTTTVYTGVVEINPNLHLRFELGLLIAVNEIAVPPVDPVDPVDPIDPIDPEVPTQNIVCSRRKLGEIFTTASEQSLDDFYEIFNEYARDAEILEEVNENFFLAQVLAEVGSNLESVRENLNYSCSALKATFGHYKRHPNEATEDGRCNGHSAHQVRIGNRAYANRIGNGNVESGDGYCFRGGGFFQLTGRANYQMVVDLINLVTGIEYNANYYADIITNVGAGLLGALAFWYDNDMKDCKNIDCTTRIINRHTDSYDKRNEYYQMIAAIEP